MTMFFGFITSIRCWCKLFLRKRDTLRIKLTRQSRKPSSLPSLYQRQGREKRLSIIEVNHPSQLLSIVTNKTQLLNTSKKGKKRPSEENKKERFIMLLNGTSSVFFLPRTSSVIRAHIRLSFPTYILKKEGMIER